MGIFWVPAITTGLKNSTKFSGKLLDIPKEISINVQLINQSLTDFIRILKCSINESELD